VEGCATPRGGAAAPASARPAPPLLPGLTAGAPAAGRDMPGCVRARAARARAQAFEKASGRAVAHKLVDRRAGDSVAVWAATETAERELGWKTRLDINDMCRDQARRPPPPFHPCALSEPSLNPLP